MTTVDTERSPESVRPPRWAEAVLRVLLRPDDAETVSGDLLEEYREAVLPSKGRRLADAWFVRQVAGFVCRASWTWGLLIGITLVSRDLVDAFVPVTQPVDIVQRSSIMSLVLLAMCALGAGWKTWRTGHLRGGLLTALAAAPIGGVISIANMLLMVALLPASVMLRRYQQGGDLAEALIVVPLLLIPIALVTGTAGAVVGKVLRISMTN